MSPSRRALCLVLFLAGGALRAQEQPKPEEPAGQEQAVPQELPPQAGESVQSLAPVPEPESNPPAQLESSATIAPQPELTPVETYPLREVERPLLLFPGLFELRSHFSYLSTERFFNDDFQSETPPKNIELFSGKLGLGYGTIDWLELGLEMPFVSGHEIYAKGQGVGDLSGYALLRLYQSRARNQELAFRLRLSAPTGEPDREFDIKDDQYVQSVLRTGDPSLDIFPALAASWRGQKFALRGFVEYGWRLAGNIKSGVEGLSDTSNFQPGPSLEIKVDFICQLADKWAPFAGLDFFYQDANKLEGEGLDDARQLLLLSPGLQYQAGPDYDIFLQAGLPLVGKNSANGYPLAAGVRTRF